MVAMVTAAVESFLMIVARWFECSAQSLQLANV